MEVVTDIVILTWDLHTPTKDEARDVPKKYVATSHEEGKTVREHGRVIFCYSRAGVTAGFGDQESVWTPTLRNLRGLIYDHQGNVLCRGLPKFFNHGEGPLGAWKPEYDSMNKVLVRKIDGFCAHIWWDEARSVWRCTTKGGSEHEFEAYGQQLLNERKLIGNWPESLDKKCVYIAEGCHPDDDHVLKEEVGLHLIGVIDMTSQPQRMQFDLDNFTEVHHVDSLDMAIALQNEATHEGYVMYIYDNNDVIHQVLKFKSPYYVQRRMAKRIARQETPGHVLYKQFQLHPWGVVLYNYEFAKEKLGDFYDDWYAAYSMLINQTEATLSNILIGAKQRLEGWQLAGYDRRQIFEAATSDTSYASLIMALYDRNDGKVLKAVNALAYLEFEKNGL